MSSNRLLILTRGSGNNTSIRLKNLVQNINQPQTSKSNHTKTIIDKTNLLESSQEMKSRYDKLYRSYLQSKSIIESGQLTPSHLKKYLIPKREKRRPNLVQEKNFLLNSKLKSQVNKLRAANFILNAKQNAHQKNDLIQNTISQQQQDEKKQFLSNIQMIFLKQRKMTIELERMKSQTFIKIDI
ncbi:hypothetical protein pb186bvf_000042 [Paramecium bursaria]